MQFTTKLSKLPNKHTQKKWINLLFDFFPFLKMILYNFVEIRNTGYPYSCLFFCLLLTSVYNRIFWEQKSIDDVRSPEFTYTTSPAGPFSWFWVSLWQGVVTLVDDTMTETAGSAQLQFPPLGFTFYKKHRAARQNGVHLTCMQVGREMWMRAPLLQYFC